VCCGAKSKPTVSFQHHGSQRRLGRLPGCGLPRSDDNWIRHHRPTVEHQLADKNGTGYELLYLPGAYTPPCRMRVIPGTRCYTAAARSRGRWSGPRTRLLRPFCSCLCRAAFAISFHRYVRENLAKILTLKLVEDKRQCGKESFHLEITRSQLHLIHGAKSHELAPPPATFCQ